MKVRRVSGQWVTWFKTRTRFLGLSLDRADLSGLGAQSLLAESSSGDAEERVRSYGRVAVLSLGRFIHCAHEMANRRRCLPDVCVARLPAVQLSTNTFLLTVALLDPLAPVKVVQKPPHSGLQTLLECVAGIPAQLAADQRGVDRIAAVVAGAVVHQGD